MARNGIHSIITLGILLIILKNCQSQSDSYEIWNNSTKIQMTCSEKEKYNSSKAFAVFSLDTNRAQKKNFNEAQKRCSEMNASLAELWTQNETNLINCIIESSVNTTGRFPPIGFWIGLRTTLGAVNNKSSYKWKSNNCSFKWTNWYDGEPSSESENCVEQRTDIKGKQQLRWNDAPCSKKNFYVCERGESTASLGCLTPAINKTTTAETSYQTTTATTTAVTTTLKFQTTTMATTTRLKTSATTNNTTFSLTETTPTQNDKVTTADPTTSPGGLTAASGTKAYNVKMCNQSSSKTSGQVSTSLKVNYTGGGQLQSPLPIQINSTYSFQVSLERITLDQVQSCYPGPPTSPGDLRVTQLFTLTNLYDVTPNPSPPEIEILYSVPVDDATLQAALSDQTYGGRGQFQLGAVEYRCVYLDPVHGSFSDRGMTVEGVDGAGVRCHSNHTTVFAVLMSVSGRVVPVLAQILTYILEGISLVSLVLTAIVLLKLRKRLRNDRTVVQINLTFALMTFHLANLLHDTALKNSRMCEVIAVVLHFTVLSSAFWMLLEGTTLLAKTTSRAMKSSNSSKSPVRYLVGWGIPALLVIGSAVPGFLLNIYLKDAGLGRYAKCWIASSEILYASVIAPVVVTIVINLFILIRVGFFIYKMSKDTESFKPIAERHTSTSAVDLDPTHLRAALRATVMLLPILSLPWVLFLLVNANVVFLYLTIVVNGLQGLFVFLVYCVFSKEVRNAAVRAWNKTDVGKRLPISRKKHNQAITSSSGSAMATTKGSEAVSTRQSTI